MRNQKAMYAIAKAKAVSAGPRRFKRFAGYALTDKELNAVYLTEGFSANKRAMNAHVDIWKTLGFVVPAKISEGDVEMVYFFTIDDAGLPMKALTSAYPDYNDNNMGVLAL